MRPRWQASGIWIGLLALMMGVPGVTGADAPPPSEALPAWLPRYDLDIHLDVAGHEVRAHQTVTWINRHERPTDELVFNAYSHYKIPDEDVGKLAKTLELLRQ